MNTPTLIIYDDRQGRFGPLNLFQAVFEIRSGVRPTRSRIEKSLNRPMGILCVPPRLQAVVAQRHPDARVNLQPAEASTCLLVNGRWAGVRHAHEINELQPGQALVQGDGQIVAVQLSAPDAGAFIASGFLVLPDKTRTVRLLERVLFERPWHLLDELPDTLLADLATSDLPPLQPQEHPGVTTFGEHPILVGEGARIMPSVVIDAEYGPVAIERGAVINPLTVLQGPCSIGEDSVLVSHTSIRRNTVIGPCSKVGGEVAGSIIQGHSNKAHAGYLGDSLVGSWVNLGADTNVSNLKNTYNSVRVQLDEDGPNEETGRVFQGAIIGDYVRTAIGTRLTTGTVVHPGCMLAVTGWGPRLATAFGFYTDEGRQPYHIDKFVTTLRAMMDRRDIQLTREQEDLIRSQSVDMS